VYGIVGGTEFCSAGFDWRILARNAAHHHASAFAYRAADFAATALKDDTSASHQAQTPGASQDPTSGYTAAARAIPTAKSRPCRRPSGRGTATAPACSTFDRPASPAGSLATIAEGSSSGYGRRTHGEAWP
jgi:hypothetical protein